jgi:hypothetical protein
MENIYQKLAKVRKLVGVLQKNKQAYGYKYVTEDEILAKVTGGMDKHGLSLIPNIIHNTTVITPYNYGKTKATKVGEIYEEKVNEILLQSDMEMIWVNNDDPEERVVVPWVLVGHQQNASMTFGSALSYTVRYFLLKFFNVSTLEDDLDAWKAKKEEAEKQEELDAAKVIVDQIDKLAKEFVGDGNDKAEKGKLLGDTLKKMVKNSDGKASANYYDITNIELAQVVKAKLEEMLEGANKKGKSE